MKKSILLLAIVGVFVFAGVSQAALPTWVEYIIGYDGYVERHSPAGSMGFFTADTLFVINNTHPGDWMDVWVEVFDKHGEIIWEGEVWDGGMPTLRIVPNGWGWFTLGMILNMVGIETKDPFGHQAAEKFYVRISAAHQQSALVMVPTVEVKQVLYATEIEAPEFAIWQPMVIRAWAEAALGGNRRTVGVIWPL